MLKNCGPVHRIHVAARAIRARRHPLQQVTYFGGGVRCLPIRVVACLEVEPPTLLPVETGPGQDASQMGTYPHTPDREFTPQAVSPRLEKLPGFGNVSVLASGQKVPQN